MGGAAGGIRQDFGRRKRIAVVLSAFLMFFSIGARMDPAAQFG
jgi:hypothetical protein